MRTRGGNRAAERLALVVEDEPASVARVRGAVEVVASRAGIGGDGAFELKLAANEAVANALAHGRGRTAAVTLASRPDEVEVEVVAAGQFRSPGRLDATHGRGLPLVVALADEVEFASEHDRTRVRIRKRARRLGGPATQAA